MCPFDVPEIGPTAAAFEGLSRDFPSGARHIQQGRRRIVHWLAVGPDVIATGLFKQKHRVGQTVGIDHVSMHGTVLNSLGLKKYGFSAETKTPPGGVIVRKPGTNEPYGLIMETAFLPVISQTTPMTKEYEIEFTKAGQRLYAEAGVTTAHEGATHLPQFQTMKRASDAGANIIDVVAFPFITDVDEIAAAIPVAEWGQYHQRLKVGGVKITVDGSPQGRTAFFTTSYLTGGPGGEQFWNGELAFPQESINRMVKKVYDMKVPLISSAWQIVVRATKSIGTAIHCIGNSF